MIEEGKAGVPKILCDYIMTAAWMLLDHFHIDHCVCSAYRGSDSFENRPYY